MSRAAENEARLERLRSKVREFPSLPGVYIMKNKVEKIIYVGKAKSLRNRVRSYLAEKIDHPKTVFLVSHLENIEYILTKTEVEAFLLEASLIKKHKPRYNIRLKDDKNYPYIKLSMADDFPRLYLARKVKQDGGLYFGPYTSSYSVRETIRFLNRSFQIRDCNDHFMRSRKRPCLTHEIGRCTAPCVGKITREEYRYELQGAVQFLKGEDQMVVGKLETRMFDEAELERFESAARLRDSIKALKNILDRQTVINQGQLSYGDQDIFGFYGDERGTVILSLHLRRGRLIGQRFNFFPLLDVRCEDEDPKDWMSSYLNQYYEENFIPDEIVLPFDLGVEMNNLIQNVLEERGKPQARVYFGTSHEAQKVLSMAEQKAKECFETHVTKSQDKLTGLQMIQDKLRLPQLPTRIECFDISNFQGQESVASQVVFEDGVPSKENYRRYKIKTVEGPNDFASMKEVLTRRFKHDEWEEPQLLVVDGGKGQLRMAVEVLKELQKSHIPVVGLAKARAQGEFSDQEVGYTEERFFLPGRSNPILFKNNTEAFRILVSIRDEAHRFAITFHRQLREKSSLQSVLDEIPGVSPQMKKDLLTQYETIDRLRELSLEELKEVKGVSARVAQRLFDELHRDHEAQDIEEGE